MVQSLIDYCSRRPCIPTYVCTYVCISSILSTAMPPTAEVPPEPPSFQLLVLVDELTFTFKTTQPASSHAFFSAQKRRSLPVMRVVFKGSLFRMHTNPQTQFFGVYQGFVGTEAYLIGGCMCSKFQNEMQSGNQNRNVLGTRQLDSLNEVCNTYVCSLHGVLLCVMFEYTYVCK